MTTLLGWSPILLMILLAIIIIAIMSFLKGNRRNSRPSIDLERRVAELEEENRLLKRDSKNFYN
ncbi:MAG: hypothetical protein ABWY25_10655 [Paenisporosarcina sp.]